ncbi:MAG: alpha/beta hydrolase [Alphaproteobacteria bacterium]
MSRAEKIQIDAGGDQSITAHYAVPTELYTSRLDETLIIMLQSFPSTPLQHDKLYLTIEFLMVDKGYHTLRFDYRGCGESDGKPQDFSIGSACEDFQTIMHWAKSKGYKRFFFVGEGLGATIALMNMDINVKGLILLWPALDLNLFRKAALNIDTCTEDETQKGYITLDDGQIIGVSLIHDLKKIDIAYALKQVFVPTIILHGARDKKIPIEQLDLARQYLLAKRVEITTFHDGEHGLTKENHRQSMLFQIQQFINRYI